MCGQHVGAERCGIHCQVIHGKAEAKGGTRGNIFAEVADTGPAGLAHVLFVRFLIFLRPPIVCVTGQGFSNHPRQGSSPQAPFPPLQSYSSLSKLEGGTGRLDWHANDSRYKFRLALLVAPANTVRCMWSHQKHGAFAGEGCP